MATKPTKDVEDAADAEDVNEESDAGSKQPSTKDGVTVSEDYQKKAHGLVHKASKHELAHLRARVSDREDKLRKEEMAKEAEDKPEEFSAEAEPS